MGSGDHEGYQDSVTHYTPALAAIVGQPASQANCGGSDNRWPVLVSHGSLFLRATGNHYGEEGAEQTGAVLS